MRHNLRNKLDIVAIFFALAVLITTYVGLVNLFLVAHFNGDKVTLYINRSGEGVSELALFAIATPFVLYAFFRIIGMIAQDWRR